MMESSYFSHYLWNCPLLHIKITVLTVFYRTQRVFGSKRSSLTWSFFNLPVLRFCWITRVKIMGDVVSGQQFIRIIACSLFLTNCRSAPQGFEGFAFNCGNVRLYEMGWHHKSGWESFSARWGSSETFGTTQGKNFPGRNPSRRHGIKNESVLTGRC